MTTTALAIYVEPDAGRGLRFSGPWLVSTPGATRVRWLAPWLQFVLSEAWNAVVLAARWLRPRLAWLVQPEQRRYVAVLLIAAGIVVLVMWQPVVLVLLAVGVMLVLFGREFDKAAGPQEVAR